MYNRDIICIDCKMKEEKRPDYEDACEAEIKEIKKGNLNFGGIGL